VSGDDSYKYKSEGNPLHKERELSPEDKELRSLLDSLD